MQELLPEHLRVLEIMLRDHVSIIDHELERVHADGRQGTVRTQRGWRDAAAILFQTLLTAHQLLKNEPLVKVTPLLMEVHAELQNLGADFSTEYLRLQMAAKR